MRRITETELENLRITVGGMMSPKRFRHTVAVEAMAERLAGLFCPEETMRLRAAGLLHDITKEWTDEAQEAYCLSHGLTVTDTDRVSTKLYHARTAAVRIAEEFPQFDDPVIVNAVRWHTTGHRSMTLTEELLFLADYIDESRTYENCVLLRRYFFGADPANMNGAARLRLLRDTMLLAYDMTVRDLLDEHRPVAPETFDARNELLLQATQNL